MRSSSVSHTRLPARRGLIVHRLTCVRSGLEDLLRNYLGFQEVYSYAGESEIGIPLADPALDIAIVGAGLDGESGLALIERQLRVSHVPFVLAADWLCHQYAALARDSGVAGMVCLKFDVLRIRSILLRVIEGDVVFPFFPISEDQALNQQKVFFLEQHSLGLDLDAIAATTDQSRKTVQNQLSMARSRAYMDLNERWLPVEPGPATKTD